MILQILLGIFASTISLFSAPPDRIPAHLIDEYTLQGKIPVEYRYFDGTYSSKEPIFYKQEDINRCIEQAQQRYQAYYADTDAALYAMLEKYNWSFRGKIVGIIGSNTPWYESIILAFGGCPTTVEYNKLITDDKRLILMTVEEYESNPIKFDAILSISSIEHDGLGRYGDPINPWGDIKSMQKMKDMLKDEGLLFLAFPYGEDRLVWNAHRIYGPIRLPLLFEGWEKIDYAPASFQPVFVLKKSQ